MADLVLQFLFAQPDNESKDACIIRVGVNPLTERIPVDQGQFFKGSNCRCDLGALCRGVRGVRLGGEPTE